VIPVKRKFGLMALLIGSLIVMPAAGYCALLTLTDSTSGAGVGSVYTLDIQTTGINTYQATLTVDTSFNPGWYIEIWDLKLGDVTSASYVARPSSFWQITTGVVPVAPTWGTFPQNQRAGGYVSGMSPALNTQAEVQQGVQLDSNTVGVDATWIFNFTSSNLSMNDLAFQVGYFSWDPGANQGEGGTKFGGRLSQTFGVPEPASVLLAGMGLGMIGLVSWRRKKRFE